MDGKTRTLVVDDEQKVLNVIEAYLIKEGFEVLTASDGEEALNIFKNEQISYCSFCFSLFIRFFCHYG